MGVAMYSILINNQDVDLIQIFILNNQISEDNQSKIKKLAACFNNAVIRFIDFSPIADSLNLDMAWPISLSAYARLFVASLLPADVSRVLYMDCDFLINGSLKSLWNTDLQDYCIGAVQDQVTPRIKQSIGLLPEASYFNSGLLLIDLSKWRTLGIEQKCLDFIAALKGKVIHHDQGVLNGVFRANWMRIPLRYNVMTIHYMMNQRRLCEYNKDFSDFYSEEEVTTAKKSPIGIHYTPSFTTRPWQKDCKHPLRNLYSFMMQHTEWHDYPLEENPYPWYVNIINWRYRNISL